MLRRKKADVLKELKDKVRYKQVIASDTEFYLEELDKIWKKLEAEQKVAQTEFSKSASYHRAIQSERQIAGVAKLPHVINFSFLKPVDKSFAFSKSESEFFLIVVFNISVYFFP